MAKWTREYQLISSGHNAPSRVQLWPDVFLRAQKSRTPKNSPDLGPDHTSFSGQRNPQYSGSGADRPGLGELERVSVEMRGQDFSDCTSGASGPGTDGDFSLQPVRLASEGIDSPRSKLRIVGKVDKKLSICYHGFDVHPTASGIFFWGAL